MILMQPVKMQHTTVHSESYEFHISNRDVQGLEFENSKDEDSFFEIPKPKKKAKSSAKTFKIKGT